MPEQVVQFLLDRLPEADSDGTRSALLHYAVSFAWMSLRNVKLVARAVPESLVAADVRGMLPVHVAIGRDNLNLVRALVELSPDSLLAKNLEGNLALHVACASDFLLEKKETLELLLEHCPESVQVRNAGRKLPLHILVSKHNPPLALLRLVVDPWPETLQMGDTEGNLPLLLAASNASASLDVVYYLLVSCPVVVCGRDIADRR